MGSSACLEAVVSREFRRKDRLEIATAILQAIGAEISYAVGNILPSKKTNPGRICAVEDLKQTKAEGDIDDLRSSPRNAGQYTPTESQLSIEDTLPFYRKSTQYGAQTYVSQPDSPHTYSAIVRRIYVYSSGIIKKFYNFVSELREDWYVRFDTISQNMRNTTLARILLKYMEYVGVVVKKPK